MCDCFHLAFPNWHAASSGTGAGRRLRAPEPNTEDDSICDEPSQFTEGERPRPQGSSPVEEFPETEKYTDSDKECEAEHDPHHKSGSGKKSKKSGLGSMFEKRSTPKMSKLKEVHSPESGVIVKTAKDGCAEGLVYGGGGKEGIFIKEVVPESPASKSLKLKEGDQILSATVYFDNVSYEDAIQILEHAQAYKVKLCLKRKPDITETEPAIESDVIPEDDLYAPEMREKGKTKRRGDARISWPKFPSFGKGRKSRFTRSHSSSEADEQRKLELSPTTSDTESPIKSQDAVKDKKKHKLKLSALTKRGRISSSEDQDTDTPTTGQISGKILQTHDTSDMLSPEFLESPSGETPKVYVKADQKVVEDLRLQQSDQKLTEPQTVQHKVELITIDNTLKTEDLTVALADKESSSGIKSPDGKKKKKERSELKMKILGKDKHKKDTKAKSPKRLKTLGASIEIPDQPDIEKSDVIPSSESHTKLQGDQLAHDANSQIISNEGSKVISAKSVTTQMEISVPKVELDISDVALIRKSPQKGEEKMTNGKDIKQKEETKISATFKLPKIGFGDITTEETVQKVNVKVEESTTKFEQLPTEGTEVKEDPYERLSKRSLSRTQLPKREEIEIPGMEDMSMRITAKGIKEPKTGFTGRYEEIKAETVPMSIDVDSVKEAVSKLPGFKLPKVDTSGVPIPEEIIVIDANAQRISVKTPTKVVDTKTKYEAHFTKYDITASPEISKTTVKLPKITPADITSEELLIETKVDLKKTEKKHKSKAKQSDKDIKTEDYKREDIIIPGKESAQEGAIHQAQDTVKIQGTAGIKFEYDSAVTLSPKESDKKTKKARITMPSFGIAKQDIKIPDIGIDFPEQNISLQKDDTLKGERTIFLQDVKMSKMESRKGKAETGEFISNAKTAEIDGIEYIDSVSGSDIKYVEAEDQTNKLPKFGAVTAEMNLNVPDADKDINIDGAEIKTFEGEGKGSKFKMPNLAISMPRVKGPKIDLSLSKKDIDVTLPQAKAEVKLQEVPEVDVTIGHVDVSIPEQRFEVEKPEVEIKPLMTEGERAGQGGKFRMPKLGITMPKVKGPDVDLSFSKKAGDVPEAKANIKIPEQSESEAEMDVQGSKFKMPKFGISMPKVKGPEIDFSLSKKDVDMSLPEAKAEVKLPDVEDVDIKAPNVDIEGPSLDVKTTAAELDGKGSKFKMPKFGISLPKVKGPDIDLSLSKKDVDVTLPKAKAEVKLPDIEGTEPGVKVEVKAPEIAIHQQDVEGSPSKFKMPTFKLPKFGVTTPNVSGEVCDVDKDVKFDGADINISKGEPACDIEAPSVDFEGPSIDMKTIGTEHEGKGTTFKKPHLGFSMPKLKGPQINLSLSKKDVDVTLPEASAEVKLPEAPKVDVSIGKADVSLPEKKIEVTKPELEIKPLQSEAELDGQGGKFKMPKLGMSMPKVKGPEIHFGMSKKDGDVTLPEAKAEVKVPEVELKEPSAKVEIKAPEIKVAAKGTEGSPSKFKMPTFKLPKFGVGTPNSSVNVPDMDKDVKTGGADINIPEEECVVNIAAPTIDIECPSIDMKTTGTEQDGKGSKFKMPHLGFSMPKVKGPKIDVSLSKKDIDVTLPEAKADVKLPEVDLGKVDVSIPDAKIEVPESKAEIQLPEAPKIAVEMKPLESEAEMDGHGGRFKLPKFGVKMPKVKGPEFDLSLSKKDVDVKLPETKADINLPDAPKIDVSLGKAEILIPEAKAEIKRPEVQIKPLQTDTELDGHGGKFKMPKFGITMPKGPEIDLGFSKKDVDVTLPEARAEVILPDAPKMSMHMTPPECEAEIDGQGSKFKMPKFGISMPKVKGPEIDLSFSKKDVDVTLPEAKAEVELPEAPKIAMDMKPAECEAEIHGQGSKFKMPKFGMSMPKVKGPEIDLSFSKKDVEVTLPEAKAEVEIPDAPKIAMDIKPPVCETEIDGQGRKFKMPKFGMSMPKVKGPEIDLSFSKKDADVTLPEAKAEVEIPDAPKIAMDIKPPVCETEIDGQGSKFKMPKFGMSMPKVKGPEIDLSFSKKDMDVTLPEAKAEVKLPDAELKEPSVKVEINAPETEAQLGHKGSPSKFKMPTFKFPKFGVATPNVSVEVPDVDKEIKIDGADMQISVPHTDIDAPEVKAQVHLPEFEVKEPSGGVVVDLQPEVEVDTKVKKPKFSLPRFSFSKPSIKSPEVDVSLPDVNAAIPEGKVEVKGGAVDVNLPECEAEIDGQGRKFKMPKFGITMPKITGPDIDLSLSKKDVDVTLPEAKAEVKLPDVELKEPSAEVEIKAPDIKVRTKDTDGSPSKFKMPTFKLPKFGIGSPTATMEVPDVDKSVSVEVSDVDKGIKIDGADMQISVPHTDIDVPEVKAQVHLPELEIKEPSGGVVIDLQPGVDVDAKLKKPKFSMPRFSFSKPSIKTPEVDVSLPDVDAAIPEGKVEVKGGEVDVNLPECEAEIDGQGRKFKMPKFGITMPKITGPDIDLSLSKKDVDVTLPEAKAEVKLPDVELKEPSAEVEIKAPDIKVVTKDTDGSPSKFKMPTFKLPKFGIGSPSATMEVPDVDKDVKIDGADMKIPEEVLTVEIAAPSIDTEGPSIDIKTTGTEYEGKGSKFKMPSLGFSVPQVKGPDIDLSLSKKDVDVTLPEAKAEVQLPDVKIKQSPAKVEIKAPEIETQTGTLEGSPSKFKMPTFKLPKFGAATPQVSVEGPDVDIKVDGADLKLPKTKAEVKLPDVEIKEPVAAISVQPAQVTEGDAKLKKPRFSLPKFSFSKQSTKEPGVDVSLPDIDVSLPEGKVEVKQPEVDLKSPEGDVELDGQGSKFKMPKFGISMPKIKGPEIDLSLSKKDVDVTLPEAKAEVQLPDVKIKQPSTKVEIKGPEIKAQAGTLEGSPSKLKMPTFTLPKFGTTTPKVSGEVPDVDINNDGAKLEVPKEGAKVDITAPSIDTEGLSADVKAKGSELQGSGSKFKMPKFGISMPKVKGPEIDLSLSKKDVDVKLPEAKAEVQLPDVKLKQSPAKVEIKAPEIETQTGTLEGLPSKLKMPTFTLPKFGTATPKVSGEVPDVDINIDGAKLEVPKEGAKVDITAPSIDTEGISVDVKAKGSELQGSGSKFKMPKFGISMPKVKGPEIDLSLSKKDVDVTLPEAKAEVQLPDVELKQPSAEVEIKSPDIKVEMKDTDVSPSKFKMPTFKFPKFGIGSPSAIVEVPDVDKDVKIDGADMKIPEEVLTVEIAAPSIDTEGPSIDIKTSGTEYEGKGSKFKMPSLGFSVPQVKGPDIDLSLSKKDVDVTLPEARAEVQLPDVELKESSAKMEIKAPGIDVQASNIEGSPSKFKMPTFKLPKFGAATPQVSVEGPDVDIKVDGADLKLPKTKAEVKLPDVEIKEPVAAISVQPAPVTEGDAKLKKPRFSLPKFSFSKQSPKEPGVDVSLPDVDVSLPEGKVEVKQPEVELKSPEVEVELDGQGSKFKMPKFGITMPKVTGPDIDLSLSKKDVDVTLPEAKAEVQLPDVKIKQPSTKVEIKGPEIKAQAGTLEGSPSKLKMPTFTLPKFGAATPKVSVEVPDVDKDINIDGAKLEVAKDGAKVNITAPSIDTEGISVDVKAKGSELEGSGSKFKMPKFGITMPRITGPDIDLSLSKKDVNVTLPEAKAEVKLPDVELKEPSAEVEINAPDIKVGTKDTDGSPSKFKMPTFKLPKFGIGSPSATVEVPDMDKNVKIDGADMKIPEEVLTVEIAAPSIDTEGPSIDIKTTGTEYEGKGSKFKMPSLGFSVPQVKGPDIDLSLSKKDVDVTLPEARAEVQLPDVELKESSAKMEIKAPGIDVQASNIEGSPSKFKMPTFKLPKFGAATPQVSVEGPDVDIEVDGADLKLPKTKAEVKLPDVEIKEPVAAISVQPAPVTEGDAKLKKPRFSLPKFSFSKQSPKEPEVDVSLPDVDVSLPEGKVEVKQPEVELKSPEVDVELDGQGSKFKMPKFGITMPKVKGPEIDLSLSKKDVDVTLPEAKAEVQLPDVKLKQSSAKVEIKGPEIKAQAGTLEGSPSKLKMPTFTLPKFGAATPKVSVEVPDVDKDINIDGAKGAKVDVTAPSIDTEGLPVDVKAKGSELEGSGSKFKMPNLAISMPKVPKGTETDLSLSKKDVDVTLPEAKAEVQLPDFQVKEPEGAISVPDAPAVEVEAKLKRPNWTFPKFSFSKTGGKAPDVDVNLETPKVDVTSPEVKAEVCLPDVEVQGPSGAISMEEPPAAELDANLKKAKFSLPRFSFSKSSMKEPEVSADLPRVDVSLPEGEVIVKQPEIEVKAPKLEAEHDGQGNKFKLPKFSITLPKAKGAEGDLSPSQKDVDITLPEVKAEVKLPEIEVKSSADVEMKASETEAKLKDVGGSPLKFKMPTMKLPKFGGATYDVTVEAPDADKLVETDETKLKEDVNVINIKSPVVDIKTDVSKVAITDADTPKTETEGLGSPSKFKLPSFKMPRLSFSKTKPEGEYVPVETECKEDELKMEVELNGESKSQKTSLTSFGEILKTIDVEFDVPKTDENLETSKEVKETDEPSGKQLEPKEKETNTKQDATKSPERTGWFKFPKFGLSSPSEPAKSSEKDDHKDEKSPVGETVDEELSPTCSVQSSDAFADISSAMTSEHVGLSLSSPTKVTVKYSDPNTALGLGEMHSNIITSTTRTELISVEPNLPEKITILSSGVSSSSEDTLRLESGKIHVITSNIQATPEAQHAKLLTAIQVQSAEGPLRKSEANEASSWTVEESHSGKRTIFERHSVRETSSEISESKETIVITKQITRMFDSSEPISGETASSIQRLKDSVHSDKMRFFDGAEK